MAARLQGKRVVITQADDYMGPATAALFAEEGAEVIADTRDLTESGACEALIAEAGRVDVLIANLASPNFAGTATPVQTPEPLAQRIETGALGDQRVEIEISANFEGLGSDDEDGAVEGPRVRGRAGGRDGRSDTSAWLHP